MSTPRYVAPGGAPAMNAFVPQLVRRDGVFGLAVGLLLLALVFAAALAMQAHLPGYAPAMPMPAAAG